MSNLNYTTYVSQVSNLMVIPSSDPNFVTMLPGMIDYAEQRVYRELDLLYTQATDTGAVTASNRNFTLPTNVGTYIIVDQINIITPVTAGTSNGTRSPVKPVALEFINAVYPSAQTAKGVPEFYAMYSNTVVTFGPSPDAAYTAEVTGTQRPTPLSSGNSSTILTQYIPDVFLAASMVFGFGYMRDFGGQSDNPQASQSWENQFQLLMKSAVVEQARARFQGEAWTSEGPSPIATPPRV